MHLCHDQVQIEKPQTMTAIISGTKQHEIPRTTLSTHFKYPENKSAVYHHAKQLMALKSGQ
jgi:hypothetical protein